MIKNYKKILAFVLGIVVSSLGVYAQNLLSSKDVSYDNSKSGSSNYCITGEESTCQKTDWSKKESGSCKKGDIIKYKVDDTDTVTFHVMYDEGETLTMQSQKNTVSVALWTDSSHNASQGPTIVLPALEKATQNWTNVKNQTYTLGTTVQEAVEYKTTYTADRGARAVVVIDK